MSSKVSEKVNIASGNSLLTEYQRLTKVLNRLSCENIRYSQLSDAGLEIPTLVGGPQPTANPLPQYVQSAQVQTGICWCSPFVTKSLIAGRNPGNPKESLTDIGQLRDFTNRYLPEARQIIDQVGGIVTGQDDPSEIILFYEEELFTRYISSLTGFDYNQVRHLISQSYNRIANVTERFIRHKNPEVTTRHIHIDKDKHDILLELVRNDQSTLEERFTANQVTNQTSEASLQMEPAGSYGTEGTNASFALMTATSRQFLSELDIQVEDLLVITDPSPYLTSQIYGENWKSNPRSIYHFDVQTAPAGRNSRNSTVLHLATLPMVTTAEGGPKFSRTTPPFYTSSQTNRGKELMQWIREDKVVPTSQTLNYDNYKTWLDRVTCSDSPSPRVTFLSSSPNASIAVNFVPEMIPEPITTLVKVLRSSEFVSTAKSEVAKRYGFEGYESLEEKEMNEIIGKEIQKRADEMRRRVWDQPPSKFYSVCIQEADDLIRTMYSG